MTHMKFKLNVQTNPCAVLLEFHHDNDFKCWFKVEMYDKVKYYEKPTCEFLSLMKRTFIACNHLSVVFQYCLHYDTLYLRAADVIKLQRPQNNLCMFCPYCVFITQTVASLQ